MKCVECLYCDKLPKPVLGISYGSPSAEDIKKFTFTHECNLNNLYLDAEEESCQYFTEKDEREQLEELREILADEFAEEKNQEAWECQLWHEKMMRQDEEQQLFREEREGNNEIYTI